MSYLNERVSYLRGLVEGLDVGESTKEGKVILAIVNVLEEMADEIIDLEESLDETDEYIQTIDEDLAQLEDDIYEDEDEDDEDVDDDEYVEVECPNCNEIIYFDPDVFTDEEPITCPQCGAELFKDEEE